MSMRVTTLMLSRGVLSDVGAASQRLARTQEKLASGRELNRPSDDPSAVARSIEMRNVIEGAQQHQRTVGEAQGWADVTDSALETINDGLQRIRELTLQGANGTLDKGQRDALNLEVKGVIESIKQAANATYAGRFVFGGTRTDAPPFAPGSDTYAGNADPILREIGQGVSIPINITGEEAIGSGTSGLIGVLRAVEANLAANDGEALAGTIGALDLRLDALNAVRAKVGATVNRLEIADARLAEYEGVALRILSDNEDADMAKAMIDFSVQQAALQAGLKAGSQVVQNSLLDFLR
jgi:flagellar hook-associated protein 3 FlgL